MQNRRLEKDGIKGKCLSVLSVFLIVFLLFQLHYSNFKTEDLPFEEAEKPNLNAPQQFHVVKPEPIQKQTFDFNIPEKFHKVKNPFDSFVEEWKEFHQKTDGYVDSIADIRRCEMQLPADVKSPGSKYINLGMTIINTDKLK